MNNLPINQKLAFNLNQTPAYLIQNSENWSESENDFLNSVFKNERAYIIENENTAHLCLLTNTNYLVLLDNNEGTKTFSLYNYGLEPFIKFDLSQTEIVHKSRLKVYNKRSFKNVLNQFDVLLDKFSADVTKITNKLLQILDENKREGYFLSHVKPNTYIKISPYSIETITISINIKFNGVFDTNNLRADLKVKKHKKVSKLLSKDSFLNNLLENNLPISFTDVFLRLEGSKKTKYITDLLGMLSNELKARNVEHFNSYIGDNTFVYYNGVFTLNNKKIGRGVLSIFFTKIVNKAVNVLSE